MTTSRLLVHRGPGGADANAVLHRRMDHCIQPPIDTGLDMGVDRLTGDAMSGKQGEATRSFNAPA
jgi:hypothetical protein